MRAFSSSSSSSDSPRDRRSRNRRMRFDSPPKESAIIANLHGLTDDPSSYRQMRELNAAAEAAAASARSEQLRLAKELYVGNIPQGLTAFALIDKLNDLLVEMGATIMPGKPILSGWLGGDNQFAFLQLRTVEECNHALALNGYTLDGYQLKVGRPKGANMQAIGNVTVSGPATQFSLDDLPGIGVTIHPPLEETTKTEQLVLVGAPMDALPEALERIISAFGDLKSCQIFDIRTIRRRSVLFEFEDVKSQRKIAGQNLVYDRDYPLAVVRPEEAIATGFMDVPNEQFSKGLGQRILPSRIIWLVNLAPIPLGLDQDLIDEITEVCGEFGPVKSVTLHRVPKDSIRNACGIVADAEPIVVVEFETVESAITCTRYMSGCAVFYFNEERFTNSDFSIFEQNYTDAVDVWTPDETHDAPKIFAGKIISAEREILAEFSSRKKHKLAPEDLEVID